METESNMAMLSELEAVAEAALLHEAMGRRGALTHDIKPIYRGAKAIGRALTVKCFPGDNLMLHLALNIAKPGDLLVATVDNFVEAGAWGEIASLAAQLRGIRGLVMDGSVRDVDAIARLNFPVFSRGVSIKGTTKRKKGEWNVPITIGGVRVHPGDFVVGDTDGVVIVPAAEIAEVVAKARALRQKEKTFMERLRQGVRTLELLDLHPALLELGLEEGPTEHEHAVSLPPGTSESKSKPGAVDSGQSERRSA